MTQADTRGGTEGGDVVYVYGIVGEGFDAARAPGGVDDAVVSAAPSPPSASPVVALISRLPRGEYGAEAIEKNSGEVAWLSSRAVAHDRVLTWAQDHGGVVPLPMFSMWENEESLRRWLGERSAQLKRLFDRISGADEFGLRVHRRDAVMMQSIDTLDAQMGKLKKEAEAASPGQRYLLERKLSEQGKGAVRAASQRMAKDIYQTLRAGAIDAVSLPLVADASARGAASDGTIVLNAAFLVDRKSSEAFRANVAAIVRNHEPRGLAFDFTGPWPPYNFVGDARGRAREGVR